MKNLQISIKKITHHSKSLENTKLNWKKKMDTDTEMTREKLSDKDLRINMEKNVQINYSL